MASVTGKRRCLDATHVADPAPFIVPGIAVQPFSPQPAARHADAVVMTDDRSEVTEDHDLAVFAAPLAQQTDNAGIGIVAIDLLKTSRFDVEFVQPACASIKTIEIAYPLAHTGVARIVQRPPI